MLASLFSVRGATGSGKWRGWLAILLNLSVCHSLLFKAGYVRVCFRVAVRWVSDMADDISIPYAWKTIVGGDAQIKRLYVLTTLAQHPHILGFDAEAKSKLLAAAATAAAARELDAFVLWEISPAHGSSHLFDPFPNRRVRPALDHPRRRRTDVQIGL
jgi:hypothetical protein